jgi:hypothetical protein
MADEDHVRAAGLRMQKAHIRHAAQYVVEALPLGKGQIAGGAMHIAGHPGIQDVVHVIPLGRTHQEGGAGKERS